MGDAGIYWNVTPSMEADGSGTVSSSPVLKPPSRLASPLP
jgi:hypothetical protein